MLRSTGEEIRVFHVDDDPELCDLVAAYLEARDDHFAVTTAVDPTAGLEHLEQSEYDCIVSDYDMPGMTGIEFFRACRKRHDTLPFVLYTGKGDREIARTAQAEGVTEYLQKGGPQTLDRLASVIRDAV